jgi:hypothetical protein
MDVDKSYSGSIPSNLNLDDLFLGIKGNKTRIRFLKEGMVYFLSLLTPDNYYGDKFKDGFITLSTKVLEKTIGKGRPTEIIKILRDKNVIEIRSYRVGHYSRGYRYSEEYQNVKPITIDFSDRINDRLSKYFKQNGEYGFNRTSQKEYSHIFTQFDPHKHKLGFDSDRVHAFIKSLGNTLIQKSSKLRTYEYQTLESIFNYFGRIVLIIDDIENSRYHLSISPTNHRFHSNLTSLPKIIRHFLLIDRSPIGEVDIMSSQPYILSTILNDPFYNSMGKGYNLHNIYEELEKEMKSSLKTVIPSNKKENPHYVLGTYLGQKQFESIVEFSQYDFTSDFYEHLLNKGLSSHPEFIHSSKVFEKGREYIKKYFIRNLFNKNENERGRNLVGELIKRTYPGLLTYSDDVNYYYPTNNLPLLLQRIESYLVLNRVCKYIHLNHPTVPFFTIHDCIITTHSNIKLVKDVSYELISKITGKSVGLTPKYFDPSTEPNDTIINKTWNKVRITKPDDYAEKRVNFTYPNIVKGIDILFDGKENRYWRRNMNIE